MFDKNKMSFLTRLRLCLRVLIKGTYDPYKYVTRGAQKQREVCEKRRRDLEKTIRPRTPYTESEFGDQ